MAKRLAGKEALVTGRSRAGVFASPDASFITGTTLDVDGGQSA